MSKLRGLFQILVLDKDDRLKLITPWFDNIVVDGGLNRIGVSDFLTHCYLGTGNAEPLPTNSGLAFPLGSSSDRSTPQAIAAQEPPYYGGVTCTFRFAPNSVVGNLSEVGVGWSTGLFSRSLIVDEFGNPTTVTILPDERVFVTYQLRNYAYTDDDYYQCVLVGIERDAVARPCNVTSSSTSGGWGMTGRKVDLSLVGSVHPGESIVAYNGSLGEITGVPSGVAAYAGYAEAMPYENNSLEMIFSATWYEDEGNLENGISAFSFHTNGMGSYQAQIDPPIVKVAGQVLHARFKVVWSRPPAVPES